MHREQKIYRKKGLFVSKRHLYLLVTEVERFTKVGAVQHGILKMGPM